MGNSSFFFIENCLTFTACEFILDLGDNELIETGFHSFAIHLILFRRAFVVRG